MAWLSCYSNAIIISKRDGSVCLVREELAEEKTKEMGFSSSEPLTLVSRWAKETKSKDVNQMVRREETLSWEGERMRIVGGEKKS